MTSEPLPLLSRVADSVYWMARYIERAENVARFIGVNLNLQLDLPLAPAQPVAAAHRHQRRRRARSRSATATATQARVIEFLAYDPENPNSIASCLRAARENARSVRETISSEMWAQVNSMYLQIQTQRSLPEPERMLDAFREIRLGCHLFQGITDATMTHNEAWHFLRLGRKLERADKTSRILDVKYFMLLPSATRRRHALRRHPLVGGAEVGQRLRDVPQEVRPHHAARRRGLPGAGPRVPARRALLHPVAPSESLHAITGTPPGALPLPLRAADGAAARRARLHLGGQRHPRTACTSISTACS